jgi:hypothetical protein
MRELAKWRLRGLIAVGLHLYDRRDDEFPSTKCVRLVSALKNSDSIGSLTQRSVARNLCAHSFAIPD